MEQIDNGQVKCLNECLGLLWHLRLNHALEGYLEALAKFLPELKGVKFMKEILECTDCLVAKSKRKPCKEERHRVYCPLKRLHSDLMGKIKPGSYLSGTNYIVRFKDDYSRYAMAFTMGNSSSHSLRKLLARD